MRLRGDEIEMHYYYYIFGLLRIGFFSKTTTDDDTWSFLRPAELLRTNAMYAISIPSSLRELLLF